MLTAPDSTVVSGAGGEGQIGRTRTFEHEPGPFTLLPYAIGAWRKSGDVPEAL